jgi:hypothetical protein
MQVPNIVSLQAISLCWSERLQLAGSAVRAANAGTPLNTTTDNANKVAVDLKLMFMAPSIDARNRGPAQERSHSVMGVLLRDPNFPVLGSSERSDATRRM